MTVVISGVPFSGAPMAVPSPALHDLYLSVGHAVTIASVSNEDGSELDGEQKIPESASISMKANS